MRAAVVGIALLLGALASTADAQVRVTAAWDANSDAHTRGYRVFVGRSPSSYEVELDAGMATSLPLDLPLGATYFIAVRAYNSVGQFGPPSPEMAVDLSGPPGPPSDLRPSVNGSEALLEWNPPASGGMAAGYLVSVGTAPGAANILNGFPVGGAQSASGVLPQGQYFARIHGVNALGVGPPSIEVAFQVNGPSPPLGPSGLSVNWAGTVAVLTWTPPVADRPADMPTSYVIEAGSSPGARDVAAISVGNVSGYAVDVPPGLFHVRVRGISPYGVSNPSNEIVVQGRGAPERPTGLWSTGAGSTVELHWSAPATGAPPTGYVIEAGSAPGLSNIVVQAVGPQTAFTTTAPPGLYYVRVRAVNARGASVPSNEITVRR
ncbi:MAG: fibronectin type III domain-containing protein [Vicinamibacterales bacterium]